MSNFEAPCSYCGEPIDPFSKFTWRRIEGWERKATAESRRSGSDIALREPRDEYACDVCISKRKNGPDPDQGSLL
jgi:hypothetical protein